MILIPQYRTARRASAVAAASVTFLQTAADTASAITYTFSSQNFGTASGDRLLVYVVDMYGKDVRPANTDEAGKAAGAVKGDTPAMRARINQALTTLLAQTQVPVDPKRVGAIGFCFGGTVALELARSGASGAGVVFFHGGLATTAPASGDTLKAKVLVLHGADDPYVPAKEVDALQVEMRAAKADWQLVSFGNAVHSFTDVDANMAGQAQYNADVARRAYAMMNDFFGATLGAP